MPFSAHQAAQGKLYACALSFNVEHNENNCGVCCPSTKLCCITCQKITLCVKQSTGKLHGVLTSKDLRLCADRNALRLEKSKLWRRFMEGRRATARPRGAVKAPAAL